MMITCRDGCSFCSFVLHSRKETFARSSKTIRAQSKYQLRLSRISHNWIINYEKSRFDAGLLINMPHPERKHEFVIGLYVQSLTIDFSIKLLLIELGQSKYKLGPNGGRLLISFVGRLVLPHFPFRALFCHLCPANWHPSTRDFNL